MKRCPKCSRTYPDDNQKFCTVDGGLLLASEQAFDPNATIQITSPYPGSPPSPQSRDSSNLGETVALYAPVPTVDVSRQTGPLTPPELSSVAPTTLLPPMPQHAPANPPAVASPVTPPAQKSKLPLILGILLLLLVLGVGAVVALFLLVIKPRLNAAQAEPPVVTRKNENENVNQNANTSVENTNTSAPPAEAEFVAPPNTTKFANSKGNLDGKLAEHYLDFSFYYPNTWELDPKAGGPGSGNFTKVERRLPPDFTQENFAVRWYPSKGTYAADLSDFPQKVAEFSAGLGNAFPGYRKVSEGPTKINSLDAYEFKWVGLSKGTEKGDLQLWGRVVFVPTGVVGDSNGAILSMFTTSLAPELSSVDDVGAKGEMPVILDSFRFAKGN